MSAEKEYTYGLFWVCLAYFLSFIFFILWIRYGGKENINYAMFLFIVGMCFNISGVAIRILNILIGADIKYEEYDGEFEQ